MKKCVAIIDPGTSLVRIGMSHNSKPSSSFHPKIGQSKHPGVVVDSSQKDYWLEGEIDERNLVWTLPISQGVVTDFDTMRKVWKHCFSNEIKLSISDTKLVVVEPVHQREEIRDKTTAILLEEFKFEAVQYIPSALASLYGSSEGKIKSGLVIECGEGYFQSVPIVDGMIRIDAVEKVDFGGTQLTDMLHKELVANGTDIPKSKAGRKIAQFIKEEYCHISVGEEKKSDDGGAEMADGTRVTLGALRYEIADTLFTDSLNIPHNICESVKKCGDDLNDVLLGNIVLSGGCTLFKGFSQRLEVELRALFPEVGSHGIKIHPASHGVDSLWIETAKLVESGAFNVWITK